MKIVDKIYPWVNVIIGISGAIIIVFDAIYPNFLNIDLKPEYQILSVLLSLLLFAAGYERRQQQVQVECQIQKVLEEISELKKMNNNIIFGISSISDFEIIEGKENITAASIRETNRAEDIIRVTTFKGKDNEETPEEYYLALGNQIKNKKNRLVYECCFNKGHKFDERKSAFKKLGFTDSEYDRMSYYEFDNQTYFNFLIIDDKVVFIGFPMHIKDKHMQIALKITAGKNTSTKNFIVSLNRWYDNFLKKDKVAVDTKLLLETK